MSYIRFVVVLALIGLVGCSKEANDMFVFDLGVGEVQMHYYETQCADPWYDLNQNDQLPVVDQRVGGMVSFLEQQQIEVLAAGYEFNEEEALACLACICQTGGVFFVKVENRAESIEKLMVIGFQM